MDSLPTPRFPEVIDSTMRASFRACPQQFFRAYVQRLAPKGEDESIHLIAGSAYAKGLEVIRTLIWGPEKLPLRQALVEAFPIVIAEYGDAQPGEKYPHKSVLSVIKALIAYFDRFPPGTDHLTPLIKENGLPAVEFSFSFPTQILHPDTGNPILYAGRFDMIGVFQDSLWVVDDKTTSQLGDSWGKQFDLRGQLVGYAHAAREFGYPVSGAIVRGCSLLKSGAFGFAEVIGYKADWQLERYWTQLHRDIFAMIRCWSDRSPEEPYGYWDYDLSDACNAFSGCEFRDLCTKSNPEEWAKGMYQERTWNPLAKPEGGQIKRLFAS